MKRLIIIALVTVLGTPAARAASDNECAIWLCLPVGFAMDGCGGALRAMIKRKLRLKSAVPSWNSCSVGDSQNVDMSMQKTSIALINDPYLGYVQVVNSASCDGEQASRWCVGTLTTVQLMQDGQPLGDGYTTDKKGKSINLDGVPIVTIDQITEPDSPRYCRDNPSSDFCNAK